MIIRQYEKPYVPKWARFDYVQVYDWQDRFIGWLPIYQDQQLQRKESKR